MSQSCSADAEYLLDAAAGLQRWLDVASVLGELTD